MRWMRKDLGKDPLRTPTWQQRMAQQAKPQEGTRLSNANPGTEPRSYPESIPLPDNDNNAGSNTLRSAFTSAVAGRGVNPDPSVPETPQNPQVPVPQRKNEQGTTYTKSSSYVEGNQNKPQGYTKTPQDSDKQN